MGVKVFSLNSVPEMEAEEVRQLLMSRGIDFYETTAGFLGISVAALWLYDERQYHEAREIIDEYQKNLSLRIKQEEIRSLTEVFRENPLRFVFYLVAIAAVLYFSVGPFLRLGK